LGNDDPQPGADNGSLSGGDGDDTATYAAGVDGRAVFSGGDGRDTASYRAHDGPSHLDGIANDGVAGEGDNNAKDVENIQGTVGNDTLNANSSVANRLLGMAGSDFLNTVDGIAANDSADGGIGMTPVAPMSATGGPAARTNLRRQRHTEAGAHPRRPCGPNARRACVKGASTRARHLDAPGCGRTCSGDRAAAQAQSG
jgi:hypothetical protein